MNFTYLETGIGTLLIAGDEEAVRHIGFPEKGQPQRPEPEWSESASGPVGQAVRQLTEYFAGSRTEFDLPLAPRGTEFQLRVWRKLQEIPYGETISYGELARRAGYTGQARAAGAATGRNPIGIIVPCHRIMGSDGSLTGYAGGLDKKRALLALEGVLSGELLAASR